MACSIDHSTITGRSFCTSCGEKIVLAVMSCLNGHEMSTAQKFCTQCGQGPKEVPVANGTPTTFPLRVPNVRPPRIESEAKGSPTEGQFGYMPSTDLTSKYQPNSFQAPAQETTGSNSTVVRYVAVGFGIVLIAAFGIAKLSANASTTDIKVNMTLSGKSCSDIGLGYDDIPGGNVNLSVDGIPVSSSSYSMSGVDEGNGCVFSATISSVREDGKSYTVTSGNVLRGSVTYTQSELSGNNWNFDLKLGG
jgi:ribosomal protein S27AE